MSADRELIDYFIEHTDRRFDEIKHQLEELKAFRWLTVGGTLAAGSILSILISIFIAAFFGGH